MPLPVLAELPSALAQAWPEHARELVTLGCSTARVVRLTRDGHGLYVKLCDIEKAATLHEEAKRLRWLGTRMPTARVLEVGANEQEAWLVTEALAGVPASDTHTPGAAVEAIGAALRALHELPIAACPFDARPSVLLPRARARVMAGVVDEQDFDPERLGRTAASVLDELESSVPSCEDLVVTHGDPCLPNLLLDGEVFTGFIDVGELGVCDRHRDLALVVRSTRRNLGPQWVEPLLTAYGLDPDPARLAFYTLLDELW